MKRLFTNCIALVVLFSFIACEEENPPFFEEINYENLSQMIIDGKTATGKSVVIIDVRPAADFYGTKGHIQDAINISLEDLQADSTVLTSAVPKSKTIVAYCFGYGNDKLFADLAKDMGYEHIYYYLAGTDNWQTKANYFVLEYEGFKTWHDAQMEETEPFADDENYLIDDLPVPWYDGTDPDHPGGHIPCATSIPLSTWYDSESSEMIDNAAAFTDHATNQDGKVVIYCGNWPCGLSLWGARIAAELGYTNVYRYQGGQQEWLDKGNTGIDGADPCGAAE